MTLCSSLKYTNTESTTLTLKLVEGCFGNESCGGKIKVSYSSTLFPSAFPTYIPSTDPTSSSTITPSSLLTSQAPTSTPTQFTVAVDVTTTLKQCDFYSASSTHFAKHDTAICIIENVCPGTFMVISDCDASSCTGDQYIRLYDSSNQLVMYDDDGCTVGSMSLCSSLSYAYTGNGCQDFILKQGCYNEESCSGVFNIYHSTTSSPSGFPSSLPTSFPTTSAPTYYPTFLPTSLPTVDPTEFPSSFPSPNPSFLTSMFPTFQPTASPTTTIKESLSCADTTDDFIIYTIYTECNNYIHIKVNCDRSVRNSSASDYYYYPTDKPTAIPTISFTPSSLPTLFPSLSPSATSTELPTFYPSSLPSTEPSKIPSSLPSSAVPTATPTSTPSITPTVDPSVEPSTTPTFLPTCAPTYIPTTTPSTIPSSLPTSTPSTTPTSLPTFAPTTKPTSTPSIIPTTQPTTPTALPTKTPTFMPTVVPSVIPTSTPSTMPTTVPSVKPTTIPTSLPTVVSTVFPTYVPTVVPSIKPTSIPTSIPTAACVITANSAVDYSGVSPWNDGVYIHSIDKTIDGDLSTFYDPLSSFPGVYKFQYNFVTNHKFSSIVVTTLDSTHQPTSMCIYTDSTLTVKLVCVSSYGSSLTTTVTFTNPVSTSSLYFVVYPGSYQIWIAEVQFLTDCSS